MVRRTVDLLPEIFRTDTNRKFLGATLDQMTQEPVLNRTQGYVGRKVGPGVNPADNYVTEPSAVRTDYQLEPGVIFLKNDTTQASDAITYPGMLDALRLQGSIVDQQDRIMQSEFYAWDSFCDLDKFTNYSQYYWLPNGPDSVDVFGTAVALTDSWEITRTSSYAFSDIAGRNPTITLVRGGNYTFDVNQPGNPFWIQASPGISGTQPATPNISSRTVLGVTGNGDDVGTVSFNVPLKTDQDFFYLMPSVGTVDLITDLKFNQLNNIYVDEFLKQNPSGIDGITQLDGRTVVFTNTTTDAESGGWQVTSQFDPLIRTQPFDQSDPLNGSPGSFDSVPYDQTTDITDTSIRYSVWQIRYVNDSQGNPYMRLQSVLLVPSLNKFSILFGASYSSTQWYKTASGFFEQIPLLTAVLDTLWYQDGTDPEIFGRLLLVDQGNDTAINIDDIIGADNYTSPNGVVFTNGLKVQFRGLVEPIGYQNLEYYVEGVGTGPGTLTRVGFVDGEAYYGQFHEYLGQKITGAFYSETIFQQFIYDTVEESLQNIGSGAPLGAPLPVAGVVGANQGNGITLTPVTDLIMPDQQNGNDPDYIIINRASKSQSAWSRGNYWFHIDVLKATATYNNQVVAVDNSVRGKRPILEFRANLSLFNNGKQAKQPVNLVDFITTDAFSTVAGSAGYNVDGYAFVNGTRVVFASDPDPLVNNQIWEVQFIDPDNTGNFIIHLIPVDNGEVLKDQGVLCLSGTVQTGKSFWFNGINWSLSQEKTRLNQPPLFDVYDDQGTSFGNNLIYPSTSFTGSRLFGYADGTGTQIDTVLGFPLRYLNINNVGDIVFENYLYTDTFLYVQDNVGQTQNISNGFVREYIDRVSFTNLIGWQVAVPEIKSRQIFAFNYASELTLDVAIETQSTVSPLQIFAEGIFINPANYVYEVTDNTTVITLLTTYPADTSIEIQAISNQVSTIGYYQVPINLENNPLNENSNIFTLGTVRTHYESIGQNLRGISGPVIGANNTRDLGNIARYGDIIVQQSSPLTLTGVVLRQRQFEFFNALQFNNQEYNKYKSLLLTRSAEGNYVNLTPTEVLDDVLLELSVGRSEISPFYWSDMLPSGNTYVENIYTYGFTSTPVFDTVQTYNFTQSNFQGLSIYLNGRILLTNVEYQVSADSPTVEIIIPLAVNDQIIIREYSATYGNFVPNTPTKMGLYPAYRPEIYVDNTYITPRQVIRGHDGSITVAFGDFRDQVLLEFEIRIFNNLKIQSAVPLTVDDVTPGQFRSTEYSLTDINNIMSTDFLTWVGWNKLDYITQAYNATNAFTYNYSQSANKLTGQPAIGAWRGIYEYYYDTDHPHTRPWEMLGLSEQPIWWEDEYGPAPYTSGNTVLWDDLVEGIIRDPMNTRVVPKYARPALLSVLPVDSEGNLLPPINTTIGNYDATSFRRSWKVGDIGPTENAWRTSSAWPFAAMRLLALTKPAQFFSLFADRDRYVYDENIEQYVWDGRYRLNASKLTPLYGNGTSKASYLNWVIDYNRQLGINSTDTLTTALSNIDVRLCWRTAGFTDKSYLKIFTERSSPDNTNSGEILPDESYQLMLYKNQPFEQVTYSSVIIQKTTDGWAILGYNQQKPYFTVYEPRPTAGTRLITVGPTQLRVSTSFSENIRQIPYGFVYSTLGAVCDFLVSYGALLEQQGLVFDWYQMCSELLTWDLQGWGVGSIVNLNPAAFGISVERTQAVVENLYDSGPENIVLNQNRQPMPTKDFLIDRLENVFSVRSLTENTINYLNLRFTAYEHMVILDNRSIFADLIYQPVTGARQSRVLITGWLTGDWTGILNAPGFVLNQDNIIEWSPNRRYAKGEIVLFKNDYWTASTIMQPGAEFNYNLWVKSDYAQVQKGLLPNAAAQSTELARAYNVNNTNLEREVDLFGYGLIGFRPRDYMQALNLDDVSQVNLYQSFLKSKGTIRSAELFSKANLGKEIAEYDITEYWAVLRSQYGATANRSYIELLLKQAELTSDPGLVQVVLPQQVSQADQAILLQDVWKSSTKLTSTDIFPTTSVVVTDVGLPSAGYVNLEDVDLTSFDFDSFDASDNLTSQVGVGTTVWIAKTSNLDWNIYTARLVPGNIVTVTDNLNGRSRVIFNKVHGLVVGDILVIRYFNTAINGIYRVRSVTDITSVLVDYQFTGDQTTISGKGVAFTLKTIRVAQASDIIKLPYARQLTAGVKIWVDNNGSDQWQVLEKTDPFTIADTKSPEIPLADTRYGVAVAQGLANLSALVGAPGYNVGSESDAPGAVYTYVKTPEDVYNQNSILTLGTIGTVGYGGSIDVGDQNWAIAGAGQSNNLRGYAVVIYRNPASNVFEQWQLLAIDPAESVTVADEFGYSVTMSLNEQWIYVGAPGGNRVYAYTRVDVEPQTVQYVADGEQNVFNYDNSIVINNNEQLIVVVGNEVLTIGTDYNTSSGNIAFSTPPLAGSLITVARRISESFIGDDSTTMFDLSRLYSATTTSAVTVIVDGILQRPIIDYTVNGLQQLTFVTAPATDLTIVARATTYWTKVAEISPPGLTGTERFGYKISTTTDGRKLIASTPYESVAGYAQAGRVYVYDRAVQNFLVSDENTVAYTTLENIVAPTSVALNNAILINSVGAVDGQYSVSGDTVTLETPISVGDIITVDINDFRLEQILESVVPEEENRFGLQADQCVNDCSLYVSSPFANTGDKVESGKVEFFINQSRVYGVITATNANPVLTPGDTIRINNFYVEYTVPTNGRSAIEQLAYDINNSGISNVVASSSNGILTISVKNFQSARALDKLQVSTGSGTLFSALGLKVYAHQQTITAPIEQDFAHFGQGLFISDNTVTLLVGAPDATAIKFTTFDDFETTFDSNSTIYSDSYSQSGAAYSYDYFPSVDASVTNPPQFIFGQQVVRDFPVTGDKFGTSVDYTTGTLLVGAPSCTVEGLKNSGCVLLLRNVNRTPAWQQIRLQQPVVDINLLNTVFMYNRTNNIPTRYFDYFDPLQGRLLGAVAQNINYISSIDPAEYNVGVLNNYGNSWRQSRVGDIWWNTSRARFIDPNQNDIVYASRRWGQLFPGSQVDIYQWVNSNVAPVDYTGPGTPLSLDNFVVSSTLNEQGVFSTNYFFWVSGINTVNTGAKKTLSIETIAQYIENPKASGISYVAPIDSSTIAIYNGLEYVSNDDTVLYVEYDQLLNDSAVHSEYQLVAENRPDGFLNTNLYRKMQDSFCGNNEIGNPVPDPFLSISERFGVQFRPRQSMFVNRFLALQNYLGQANVVLSQFPISEARRFNLLNSSEPEPSSFSGAWDKRVANYEELTFQNLLEVPVGYHYLVASDVNYRGLWTIYQAIAGAIPGSKELVLVRVQNYDTKLYWNFVNWYRPGYNTATRILLEVPVFSSLSTIVVPEGSSVKVMANAQGKWEIYQLTDGVWQRVALQDGTIEFSAQLWDYALGRYGFDLEVFDAQFFDQEPVIETRKIIQAINQELLIDDLAIERNRLLILMFNYVLTEQQAPTWLTKTSLIDVDHTIRELIPYQAYRRDNQEFVIDYINEVKPYHTQIREFNLIYKGADTFQGNVADFDLPAYWDADLNLFVSPVLDDTGGTISTTSSVPSTSVVWQSFPWNQWYQNYLLSIESALIVNGGSGYTVAPEVIVTGNSVETAEMVAIINSSGQVSAIEVINPGSGYLTTAIIALIGGNGTGAQAVAVMGNSLVRSIATTIKYDRYEYNTTVSEWQADQLYSVDTLVRYANRVWQADTEVQTADFDPINWTIVPAGDLSGVDRTMGYYVPRVNEPGLDLALLIAGIDYPGVQVSAPDFDRNTGFDVGNYDINPFDNIAFGPEGRPTYDPAILDSIYESQFTDTFLGTRPTDINVDGGAFVDTYSSHAPEELVPGAIFDTLDMRVFTTPGADWDNTGHGFPTGTEKLVYSNSTDAFDFAHLVDYPVTLQVWNQTRRVQLIPDLDFQVNWTQLTVEIIDVNGANNGEIIVITAYGLGGGNQLYINSYNGSQATDSVIIPINSNLVESAVVFANGNIVSSTTFEPSGNYNTEVLFPVTFGPNDYIVVTLFGATDATPSYSWSTPITQYFVADGTLTFELSNYFAGTNPANIVVERNGIRARPAEGVEYVSDGTTIEYPLPTRGGYSQALVADADVSVYVDNVALIPIVDFTLTPVDGSSDRSVILLDVPAVDATILISVETAAQYIISGTNVLWKLTGSLIPIIGDIISVTTWNDTREQDILTQVFQGPTVQGITLSEGFDDAEFDSGLLSGQPGSFDYSSGGQITTNRFDTGRIITKPERLLVTLDGDYLFNNVEYTVEGSEVVLSGPAINAVQVVAITSFTDSEVPGKIGFRIFQDMRGLQLTYRITDLTTTELVQELSAESDIIYVADASRLSQPDLTNGIFGFVTIDGERISYRERNTIDNTVSGLRRGTAGTGCASHAVGVAVYDIGIINMLPPQYQNSIVDENFLANGTTVEFVTDIRIDSAEMLDAVEVYVGGVRQSADAYTVDSANPVSITFAQPPTANYQVTILIKQGASWYQPGPTTPSNGIALQEQDTLAARFIRDN